MEYQGPERRSMDSIELMISTIKDLFNQKMDTLESRLDKFEVDTKADIEKVGARVENAINVYEMRGRMAIDEMKDEVSKLKHRVFELEQAPLKKAAEVQKGFFSKGRELVTGAIWTAILGFLGFLVAHYIGVIK